MIAGLIKIHPLAKGPGHILYDPSSRTRWV